MNGMENKSRGMALIELVVALGAVSLVTLLGMRGIRSLLEKMAQQATTELENLSVEGLSESMRSAWDQRIAHFLSDDPWLFVDGQGVDGGYALHSIEIATASGELAPCRFKLRREGTRWRLGWENEAKKTAWRTLSYAGDILTDLPPGRYSKQESPLLVRFRFPDACDPGTRQGFAIGRFW